MRIARLRKRDFERVEQYDTGQISGKRRRQRHFERRKVFRREGPVRRQHERDVTLPSSFEYSNCRFSCERRGEVPPSASSKSRSRTRFQEFQNFDFAKKKLEKTVLRECVTRASKSIPRSNSPKNRLATS